MKKTIKIVALTVLIAILSFSTVGCKKIDDVTARDIVNALVEDSYELNKIYFGKGLQMQESDSENLYIHVAGNSNYTSRRALEKRTREVFSSDYASDIIDIAFNGSGGAYGSDAVLARYIEFDDYLHVRRDIDGIEVARYDLTKTEITKVSNRFIRARLRLLDEGKEKFVEIVLINEENGWRIDSATY